MNAKHTPGPWYADKDGRIWRRPPENLYENGGGVAGDKSLAIVNRGWWGDEQKGFPVEANARLIAAAPDLLEVLRAVRDDDSVNETLANAITAAIAKAEGRS